MHLHFSTHFINKIDAQFVFYSKRDDRWDYLLWRIFFYEGTKSGDCQVDTKIKTLQLLAFPKIFFVDQGLFYQYILVFKLSYLAVAKSLRGSKLICSNNC